MEAAKKDEMPIGKWVDRALSEAAEGRLKAGPFGFALPTEPSRCGAEWQMRLSRTAEDAVASRA